MCKKKGENGVEKLVKQITIIISMLKVEQELDLLTNG